MNMDLSDITDSNNENLMVINLEDEVTSEDTSQPAANDKQFNISARRRIEEYLESKRLASLTEDFNYTDFADFAD